MIDAITAVQYSGYFQNSVRKYKEAGKVNLDNEEARVQAILEAERKRVQPVAHAKGRIIEPQMLEKGVKERRVESHELGEIVDILV